MNTLFALLFLVSIVVLIAGLIKPSIVKQASRKHVGYIFGGVAVLLLIALSITSPATNNQQQTIIAATETTAAATTTQQKSPLSTPTPNKPQAAVGAADSNTSQTQKITAPVAPTAISTETVSQKNAVRKAQSYLDFSGFSHDGLVDQLEYDQFSPADATYGADNSGANWDDEAIVKARSYMQFSGFSRNGLIAQLEYDKFTQEQAEYGANAVGL